DPAAGEADLSAPSRPSRRGGLPGDGAGEPAAAPALDPSAGRRDGVLLIRRARGVRAFPGFSDLSARNRRDRRRGQFERDRPRSVPQHLPGLLRERPVRGAGPHERRIAPGPPPRLPPARAAPDRGERAARERPVPGPGPGSGLPEGGLLAEIPQDRRPVAGPRALGFAGAVSEVQAFLGERPQLKAVFGNRSRSMLKDASAGH